MNNIMVDLETVDTNYTAPIIAIGAVEFDIEKQLIGEKFHVIVDLMSSVQAGAVIDPDTFLFWMKQSDEARSVFKREGKNIKKALIDFTSFVNNVSDVENVKIWGNGAAFDNVILEAAYNRLEMKPPWKFWNDRCYRTIKNIHPTVKLERIGTLHNAVDDAESQACHLIKMLNNDLGKDLDRFVEFYKSISIECKVNKSQEGYYIILGNMFYEDKEWTISNKFDGYNGFYSKINFDNKGSFISQEFLE